MLYYGNKCKYIFKNMVFYANLGYYSVVAVIIEREKIMELARYGYGILSFREVEAIYYIARAKRHFGRARAALAMLRRYEAEGRMY